MISFIFWAHWVNHSMLLANMSAKACGRKQVCKLKDFLLIKITRGRQSRYVKAEENT